MPSSYVTGSSNGSSAHLALPMPLSFMVTQNVDYEHNDELDYSVNPTGLGALGSSQMILSGVKPLKRWKRRCLLIKFALNSEPLNRTAQCRPNESVFVGERVSVRRENPYQRSPRVGYTSLNCMSSKGSPRMVAVPI
ncbi:unnamed protein product [Caenorhabditis auriculariae]|uniref:Uncharacterized protein n=1 Tax=Caenorhabditis auriculariae TaxID=2777116 RepID=A0A8S1GNQ2_9PELO|nr:unnamed protein product [Caenorhabditis auriculariae]